MASNIVKFPKVYRTPPHLEAIPPSYVDMMDPPIVAEVKVTHHHETFDYNDDSYIVLVLPKDEKFTVDKMVFMAERLKLQLFSLLNECYDDNEGDVDPPSAS